MKNGFLIVRIEAKKRNSMHNLMNRLSVNQGVHHFFVNNNNNNKQ